MSTRWFTDASAQAQHRQIADHLKPMVASMLGPGYELSHLGINKDEATGEVLLRLHLNPIGRVRVESDPLRINLDGGSKQ
jgi:hypothetical protein